MPLDINILGEGVYSPKQVARLVGCTQNDVWRWTRAESNTLMKAHFHEIENSTELSFADLIDLRVVKGLRRANISMQKIRFAISYSQEKLGIERPLSSLSFKIDGKQIIIEALEKDGELLSLDKSNAGQKIFAKLIDQSLQDLEYEDDRVVRWRPSFARGVVIDPSRNFGDPLIDKYGISTEIIAKEFLVFGSKKYLSKIYEIPTKDIDVALKFEKGLDKY